MAEWLTPRTPDLEVRGPSLIRRVISLDRGTLLSLHPGENRRHTAWGGGGGRGNPAMD